MSFQRKIREVQEKHFRKGATPAYYVIALCGETGELANLFKRLELHGRSVSREEIAGELADILVYTSLIADVYEVDLEKAVDQALTKIKKRCEDNYYGQAQKAPEATLTLRSNVPIEEAV